MLPLKEEILKGIYKEFAQWFDEKIVCEKGCSVCCTQNVLVTAVEGELIHRYVRERGLEKWLAARMKEKGATRRVQVTTNSFAASCLKGDDIEPESYGNEKPCPFLKENSCTIYKVRPFSCRCFISEIKCKPGVFAEIGAAYLSASSAVMQIIEHLSQGEYFGNLFDVLLALSDLPENRKLFGMLPSSLSNQGRANVNKARPLPGFLLVENEMGKVQPLLEAIFTHRIGERSIGEILNNR